MNLAGKCLDALCYGIVLGTKAFLICALALATVIGVIFKSAKK